MKILLNYDKKLENYKGVIAGLAKTKGLEVLATGRTLQIAELLEAAKSIKAEGILLANEDTLQHCIADSSKKITLDKYRGSRLNFSIPVIVGAPLDHLRKIPYGKWLYERDLEKFKKIKVPPTQLQFTVCDSQEKLFQCAFIANEALLISIDIETDLCMRITCVSFTCFLATGKLYTFVIPLIEFGKDYWHKDAEYEDALRTMQDVCRNAVPKVFFNGPYDAQYLIRYNCEPRNYVVDVMGLAHAEYSELPKSLDFVASRLLYDYYFWKDEADEAYKNGDYNRYLAYCARDSWNTLRCFFALMHSCQPHTIKNYQMVFKMCYPFLYCNYEGSLVDTAARDANKAKAQAVVDKSLQDLRTIAADPNFNPNSPKQVQELLFDILGAKPIRNQRTTKEKALVAIAAQHPLLDIVIQKILDYRGEAKAISTYFEFALLEGRALYNLNPWGTDTTRASSQQSNFRFFDREKDKIRNYGLQIQNVPAYAKDMIVADEGYVLAEADNNKSEARCVAYDSQCPAMIAALEDSTRDFYKTLGTLFFGIAYEDVSKDLRNKILKRIVHGRNYLMGGKTLVEHASAKQLLEGAALLGIQVTDIVHFADYLLSLYNKPFPEINEWYKRIRLEVMRTHRLVSPIGYTRYFFGDIIKDHDVYRGAVAHGPQNLSVMIVNRGMWRVYKELVLTSNGEFRLKGQVHDSIKAQFIEAKKDYYSKRMLECMDNPITIHGKLMKIPVDIGIGKRWIDAKG